jgi:hypothetical protein
MIIGFNLLTSLRRLGVSYLPRTIYNSFSEERKKVMFKRITDEKPKTPDPSVSADSASSTIKLKPYHGLRITKHSNNEDDIEAAEDKVERPRMRVKFRN